MIRSRALRGEQEEQDVGRLTIEGFEVDRAIKPCQEAEETVELRQLAVRNCNAFPDAGGAKPLALQQSLVDYALLKTRQPRRLSGKLVQRLLLATDPQSGQHGFGTKKFQQGHSSDRGQEQDTSGPIAIARQTAGQQ